MYPLKGGVIFICIYTSPYVVIKMNDIFYKLLSRCGEATSNILDNKNPLAVRLQAVENLHTQIEDMVNVFGEAFGGKYAPSLPVDNEIVNQKKIFAEYEENLVLQRAFNRERTIEGTLEDLSRVYEGFRKYLPRRIDREHNKQVDDISELVGNVQHLRTYGTFYPDNPVTITAYIGVGTSIILYSSSLILVDVTPDMIKALAVMAGLITGIAGSGVGLAAEKMIRKGKIPIEEARYLDTTIKQIIS